MTDNEIIKALECCVVDTVGTRCWDCPFAKINDCGSALFKDTLSLINRQKAEIERLREKNKRLFAENVGITHSSTEIKAEAIKEFAERLKAIFDRNAADYVYYVIVDYVAKEMGAGDNGRM